MYRIIDKRCSGKTSRLLLLAKENNGIVVCRNPERMREKAYGYGLTGIDFVSYEDFDYDVSNSHSSGQGYGKPVYIDELDAYLRYLNYDIQGYTISED